MVSLLIFYFIIVIIITGKVRGSIYIYKATLYNVHFHVLTLFYTRRLEIVVLHVMVPQPYRFSPLRFHIGMVI